MRPTANLELSKCARSRCKTCPFIYNVEKMSEPERSIKITDHFTCTSANVIYCVTSIWYKKLYISETGRRLGDRFREQFREVERNEKDASKPVARHYDFPNYSEQHIAVCGISLYLSNSESRKTLEQIREEKFLYLKITMYYFVYYINKIAHFWQEKSTWLINENKRIDNPRQQYPSVALDMIVHTKALKNS